MASNNANLPEGTDTVIDSAADEEAKTALTKAKERAKEEANNLKDTASGKAREYAHTGKEKASTALKDVSAALDDAAGSVDSRLGENYGEYAHMAATAVSRFAEKIDGKEIDDLVEDAQNFVRKSPVLAIGVAAVAGFALARLVKSGMGEQTDA